jgi:methionyl-tRNA synthetase
MVNRYQQGIIGEMVIGSHDDGPYHEALENCQFDRALDWVWDMIKDISAYIEQTKPWQLAKEANEAHLRDVLAACVADILQVAILLEPFLPDTSAAIQKIFSDGQVQEYTGVLFPRIEE